VNVLDFEEEEEKATHLQLLGTAHLQPIGTTQQKRKSIAVQERENTIKAELRDLRLGGQKLKERSQFKTFMNFFEGKVGDMAEGQKGAEFTGVLKRAMDQSYKKEFSKIPVSTGQSVADEIKALRKARIKANKKNGYAMFKAVRDGKDSCEFCKQPLHVGLSCDQMKKIIAQKQAEVDAELEVERKRQEVEKRIREEEEALNGKIAAEVSPDSDDSSNDGASEGETDTTPIDLIITNHKNYQPDGPELIVTLPRNAQVLAARKAIAEKLGESLDNIKISTTGKGARPAFDDGNLRYMMSFPKFYLSPEVNIASKLSDNPEPEPASDYAANDEVEVRYEGKWYQAWVVSPAVDGKVGVIDTWHSTHAMDLKDVKRVAKLERRLSVAQIILGEETF